MTLNENVINTPIKAEIFRIDFKNMTQYMLSKRNSLQI